MIDPQDIAVPMEVYLRAGGRLHTLKACRETRKAGGPTHCVIHNPSFHPLLGSAMTLRGNGLIERICRHGIGHYDPDSVAYFEWRNPADAGYMGIHGCDGCCQRVDRD